MLDGSGMVTIVLYDQGTKKLTLRLSLQASHWLGVVMAVPRPKNSGWWVTQLLFEESELVPSAARSNGVRDPLAPGS